MLQVERTASLRSVTTALALVAVGAVMSACGGATTGGTTTAEHGLSSAVAGTGGDDTTSGAGNSPVGSSAHDVCVVQLIATAVDLHDNGTAGLTNEIGVNGSSDPFITEGQILSSGYVADFYTVGAAGARTKLRANASQSCTDTLGDAQREGYPTDGTYPNADELQNSAGSDSSTDDGNDGMPCPNGGQAASDDQGNLVCQ